MPEENSSPMWAVVELMGHNRTGGLVSKDTMMGTPLLRVDVPQADGSSVSQLVNPTSIYRMTFCSEDIARKAATMSDAMPLHSWELPTPALTDKEEELPEPPPYLGPRSDDDENDDEHF